MGIIRSYFSKNNTLIEDNRTNNSQNPVSEISYGTVNSLVSRLIFDIDVETLAERISSGEITQAQIGTHTLKMTNTIRQTPERISGIFDTGIFSIF